MTPHNVLPATFLDSQRYVAGAPRFAPILCGGPE